MFSVFFLVATNLLKLPLKLKDICGMTNMTCLKVLLSGQSVRCTLHGVFIYLRVSLSRLLNSVVTIVSSQLHCFPSCHQVYSHFDQMVLSLFVFPQKACSTKQWSLEITGCNVSIWLAIIFCVVHVLTAKDDKRWASNLDLT